jgi:hypothetical protein
MLSEAELLAGNKADAAALAMQALALSRAPHAYHQN